MVNGIVGDGVIPYMTAQVTTLNDQVLEKRSGLGYKMSLWLGRGDSKSKGPRPHSSHPRLLLRSSSVKVGPRYDVGSIEYKQRRLADWAYMLEDYWLANRTYRALIELFHAEGADACLFEAGYITYALFHPFKCI